MIVLAAVVLGALWGAWKARAGGGRWLDAAQYAAAHAIALGILALLVAIILERMSA